MTEHQRRPVQAEPYNAEAPMPVLDKPITPDGLFYVRSHFPVPDYDPATWRLNVELYPGEREPRFLSLADLRALPRRSVTVTLECAGNGRTTLDPPAPGTPWAFGAVSTAEFTGTSLRNLLVEGPMPETTVEVVFTGADGGRIATGETIQYGRSLTPEVALHPDTILAWEMNGQALPSEHGCPLRLIVPRWYGVASVKWLSAIRAVDQPYDGYYQTTDYVYNGQAGLPDGTPVTTMRVRAVIAQPQEGESLRCELQMISGTAWCGDAPVERVEISTDGGESWQTAEMDAPLSVYAATAWRYPWTPLSVGEHVLVVRATDVDGNTQPMRQVWTEQGYGNNAVQRVTVVVIA